MMAAELAGTGPWTAEVATVRVRFGEGRLAELGEVARRLGGRRVLLITDPGVRAAGHVDTAMASLREADLEPQVFDGVAPNPTTRHVAQGVEAALSRPPDLIVGMGGGSAMDCAKGINFVLTNGGRMEDYWGVDRARRPMLPAVGVPTTAGTGSEAQSFALIGQEGSHRKMACGDEKARFRAVILDPSLTRSVPAPVAAAAGLDATSHALESYVSRRANPVSRMLAREAWRLLDADLESALKLPQLAPARANVLIAAHLAGAAIEQSMLGAAHACANPLTARFGLSHGVAVAMMLPSVVCYNGAAAADRYAELAAAVGRLDRSPDPAAAVADRFLELRAAAALPGGLGDLGVPRRVLPELATEAAGEWTAGFNPRPVEESDLLRLYEASY